MIFQSFAFFFQSSAFAHVAFLEISWLEAEAKHHRLFRCFALFNLWRGRFSKQICGDSTETIYLNPRNNLWSPFFIYFAWLISWGFGRFKRESQGRNPKPSNFAILEAEVEQVDSEVHGSGTHGQWFLVAKPLTVCFFVLKKEHTLRPKFPTACQKRTGFASVVRCLPPWVFLVWEF